MQLSLARGGPLAALRSGCIVVGVHAGGRMSAAATALDEASRGALQAALARGDLGGELGQTLLLPGMPALPGIAAERVLLVGLGPALTESRYVEAAGHAARALATTGAADALLCLPELPVPGRGAAWKIEQAVLAVRRALYRFDRFRREPPPGPRLQQLTLRVPDDETLDVERMRAHIAAVADGIDFAKDLGNLPGNTCTPTLLAEQARRLERLPGVAVSVLGPPEMQRLGMGALLAVARGSHEPPRLIVVEYHGAPGGGAPVALVGKGITFDAGGLSLKPPADMEEMKFDMCGGASVLGALQAAASLQLPLNIVGLVPAAENMPGGNALKPGDVVTTLSGLSVEVVDTDYEGRLALADALTYARRYRPAAVIDVATLTGEIVGALGPVASGLFANDESLMHALLQAGDRAWDRAWAMPLWEEYAAPLKSSVADLPNIGARDDCAGIAAAFLSHFTEGLPWAHLDIAGTASTSGADRSATGRPVGLLVHFLAGWAAGAQHMP
ncbi:MULTISPECIES: leucyl aminopeptidase [unclassified Roseateles]|uniref:leucyl aminopeptidase n=1 Tax=unclassified Roseateles TaxID=2626991 RepID=UPI0006FA13D1|nr:MULTISPECIES: leucyl aminopeptidase [unclassified Roseateles]KQW42505.1 hypothetical protein ASC81_21725 [Pelomonas sp. Root405]KRA68386.1 hypothetical protein ASD88_23310 [Pelomonas sp. Root662]